MFDAGLALVKVESIELDKERLRAAKSDFTKVLSILRVVEARHSSECVSCLTATEDLQHGTVGSSFLTFL